MGLKPANPNNPPSTTVSNIPVNGDTLFALVTLHWDGGDQDGFVTKYQYRYITKNVQTGDSTVTPWTDTKETSKTISFNSPNKLNKQIFEVRSVDNTGDSDPSPAVKYFYTKQTHPPQVTIAQPKNNDSFFYKDKVTDWYKGVTLTFSGKDSDGEIEKYGWAVDNGDWNWTQDTTVTITPKYFKRAGEHIIRLTAMDNTSLLSNNPDTVNINLIKPQFDKGILIIDETNEQEFPPGTNFTDQDVDNFYADIFNTQNQWDFIKNGMPPRSVLGHYKLIVWHADNNFSNASDAHKLPQHTDEIEDYMNVGGDFIMSGWRILKSFVPDQPFPQDFRNGTFVHDYLNIEQADETPLTVPGDFIGASGNNGFSDVMVDTTKLKGIFPYYGKLVQINTITKRGGFTKVIYAYNAQENSQIPTFRGEPVGLQYYGTSFNSAVLGFPIFFLKKADATTLANQILTSMKFNTSQ